MQAWLALLEERVCQAFPAEQAWLASPAEPVQEVAMQAWLALLAKRVYRASPAEPVAMLHLAACPEPPPKLPPLEQ